MPLRRVLVCCSALLLLGTGARARRADGPPYAPAESMATMQLEAGYRIELVAAEPDVQSPVAMDFDEQGRLFVVEMPGYPLDTRPTGRVKLLEDADGDGRYETGRVFADGLVLPTGVMRWKKGILVTAPPDLLYFEDTDGDGRADVRTVVLTGFAVTNPQHMVNGPVYGLDNWIHLAHEGPAHAVIYQDLFGDRGTPPALARASAASSRLRRSAAACGCVRMPGSWRPRPARRSTATASMPGAATSPPRTPIMRGTK